MEIKMNGLGIVLNFRDKRITNEFIKIFDVREAPENTAEVAARTNDGKHFFVMCYNRVHRMKWMEALGPDFDRWVEKEIGNKINEDGAVVDTELGPVEICHID